VIDLASVDVAAIPSAELPSLLGKIVEIEARIRLRLAAVPPTQGAATASRVLTVAEAAAAAGTSTRFLLAKTRGKRFRVDLSRKQPRFEEAGLRAWLATRSK